MTPKNQYIDLDLYRPDFSANLTQPRHGWYPFKEGYSSSLVASFLMDFADKRSGLVLDPFGGSGTTGLEAASWGWNSFVIEVNPFLAFLCRVKSAREYSVERLLRGFHRVAKAPRRRDWRLPDDTTLVERRGLEKWLLNRGVATRFEQIRGAIVREVADPRCRDLLVLALIRAATSVANAKRDGKCWRYLSDWRARAYSAEDLDAKFESVVSSYVADLQGAGRVSGSVTVRRDDCRSWFASKGSALEGKVDVCLTSPPYLNSFDYTDIYRPECLLLGAARTSADLRKIRFATFRSHVQVSWEPSPVLGIGSVRDLVARLERATLWSNRIPAMVNAYFHDIGLVLRGALSALRRGGVMGVVVANSAYDGVVIPVDEIVAELACAVGFSESNVTVLRHTLGNGHHQKRSEHGLRESLVVARV